jgi:hypothetical protein
VAVPAAVALLDDWDNFMRANGSGDGIFKSPDPYVADTANAIESKFPGRVKEVNKIVRDETGRIITDYDIELNDVIIQVKSGSAKGLTTQIQNTAQSTTKIVIGYTPDLNPSSAVVKGVQNSGYECFTTLEELLDYLNEIITEEVNYEMD